MWTAVDTKVIVPPKRKLCLKRFKLGFKAELVVLRTLVKVAEDLKHLCFFCKN